MRLAAFAVPMAPCGRWTSKPHSKRSFSNSRRTAVRRTPSGSTAGTASPSRPGWHALRGRKLTIPLPLAYHPQIVAGVPYHVLAGTTHHYFLCLLFNPQWHAPSIVCVSTTRMSTSSHFASHGLHVGQRAIHCHSEAPIYRILIRSYMVLAHPCNDRQHDSYCQPTRSSFFHVHPPHVSRSVSSRSSPIGCGFCI
jgi:hypothetical protein